MEASIYGKEKIPISPSSNNLQFVLIMFISVIELLVNNQLIPFD